jgi:putative Mg2+ transporter-C (MgtC) family protein
MDWLDYDIMLPIAGSVVAGALIGLEREYRGRPAGFRTHILVCLASSLLMLAAVHQVHWLSDTPYEIIRIDPVRMAHGILTGIGFLCGGVIFRENFTVHGLTTAASLWITSALGTLYGVGFYGLAVGGTLATLGVLGLLRLTEAAVAQLRHMDVRVRFRRGAHASEDEFRTLLARHGLTASTVTHRLLDEGVVELSTTVRSRRLNTAAVAEALCADEKVVGYDLLPRQE